MTTIRAVMKRAVIYLRTSSNRQIDNTSLDTQEQICRNYCLTEGFELIDIKKLETVSAKETNTARAAELLEFCKRRKFKFDVLVVFKLDRFARSQEQHHWLRGQIMKMGIHLRSATEPDR
ncbi:MAG: recombinase family protein [Anaerolineae bacterium]